MQEYIVKERDTLWKIAKSHGTSVDALAHLNGLGGSQVHHLSVGQKLKLPDAAGEPDSMLKLQFRGLDFGTFTPKKVKVEHDGKTVEHSMEGANALMLSIQDHAKGLKVWIEDLNKKLVQVMDHAVLPIGTWNVAVDSRQVMIKGNMLPDKGKQATTTDKVVDKTASKAQQTGGQTVQAQVRTEGGAPVHALATIYTEENLRLNSGNEVYRKFLIDAAKKHGLTPQSLAALLDAEAAKVKGVWQENSNSDDPSLAQGLAQFFEAAWMGVYNDSSSLLHAECQGLSHSALLKKRLEAKYAIDAAATYAIINLKIFSKMSNLSVDGLPPDEKAKMAYLLHHEGAGGALRLLGVHPKKGPLTSAEAKKLLAGQLGKKNTKKLEQIIDQYGGDEVAAYKGWLFSYIDTKININNFVVQDAQKFAKPIKTMGEVVAGLTGKPAPPKPQPKDPAPPIKKPPPASKPAAAPAAAPAVAHATKPTAPAASPPAAVVPSAPTSQPVVVPAVGSDDSHWHNPLAVCTLRSAGLSSTLGAKFGMTRKNGTKAHQGIDLIAIPGTPIFAVADGTVHMMPIPYKGYAYGNTIVLEVGVDDLPVSLAQYCQKVNPGRKTIGFMYAHLQPFETKNLKPFSVHAGDKIGETGCSGNAAGMDTVDKGAHLHFEVRLNALLKCGGLANRADPLVFIKNCTNK